MPTRCPPKRSYIKPDVVAGYEELLVYPTSLRNPHEVYLQLDGPSYSEELDKLHHVVQRFYNGGLNANDWFIYSPKIGAC